MELDLLRYIDENPYKVQEWLVCPDASNYTCVMQWANDGLEIALRHAYRNVDGSFVDNGAYLGDAYYKIALPIVWDQMAAAAVRFAYTLDLAF